jgi:hypothetical protein
MGLESGTVIEDFNTAWPLGTDDVSQGDDHLRLIKSILANVFPGNSAPMVFDSATDLHIDNADIYQRSGRCSENMTVIGEIGANAQVAIAGFIFNGTNATFMDNRFGVVGIQRTNGAPVGSYEVTLVEAPGEDGVGSGSAAIGLIGGLQVNVYKTATPNVVQVQCRAPGANNNPLTDGDYITVSVLDTGRVEV